MREPAKLQRATVTDLLALPETSRRYEVIDGVLVEKEAASGRHGGAQVRIARRLGPYDRRPGGRWLAGGRRRLAPRSSGRASGGVPIRVRPDWICEILSTNEQNDLIKKKRVYHRHQVGHYWIVDPIEETLAVYR